MIRHVGLGVPVEHMNLFQKITINHRKEHISTLQCLRPIYCNERQALSDPREFNAFPRKIRGPSQVQPENLLPSRTTKKTSKSGPFDGSLSAASAGISIEITPSIS
ncbi:MAG: hypothetical protein NTV97_32580 [Alphaproteobacteria bacterium]|nr:hypothetical protein [Alphaproteobacteria bacterium]